MELVLLLLNSLCYRVRLLAQELKPGLLNTRVMLRGLNQVHECLNGEFQSLTELRVNDTTLWVENLVSLSEREHIREDARAKVLQRLAQRPQPPVSTDH